MGLDPRTPGSQPGPKADGSTIEPPRCPYFVLLNVCCKPHRVDSMSHLSAVPGSSLALLQVTGRKESLELFFFFNWGLTKIKYV